MANIVEQIDTIKTTTEDAELREAIASALEALSEADQTKAIESLKSTLMSLSEKLNSKADKEETEPVKLTQSDINKLNELKDAINEITRQMSLKVSAGQFQRLQTEVNEKADKASVENELRLKASKESVNKVTNALDAKADSSEVARALSLKADSKTVSELSKKLDEKADAKDITGLEFKMGGTTRGMRSAPTESDLAPMIKSAVEQYATEELVTLLRSYTNEQLNLKVNQSLYDAVVGSGFQGWTITDYIIRIREDYNTALAEMLTRTEANAVMGEAVEAAGSIVQIGGTKNSSSKLYFDSSDLDSVQTISLATMDDVNAAVSPINRYLSFTLKTTFEEGGLDLHGWAEVDAKKARTVGYLSNRSFTLTLPSGFKMKVFGYDQYKIVLGISPDYLTGNVSYDVSNMPNAVYIKLVITRADDADIASSISTLNNIVITMYGTDWYGSNDKNVASIGYVNKKVSKDQGVANAGKVLTVGSDGNVVLASNGLSDTLKQVLIDCFADVAWSTDQGPIHCAALLSALNTSDTLSNAPVARSMKKTEVVEDIKEEPVEVEEEIEEEEVKEEAQDIILVPLTLSEGLSLTETLAENTRMSAVLTSGEYRYEDTDYYAIPVPEGMSSVTVTAEDTNDISIASFSISAGATMKLKQTDYVNGECFLDVTGADCIWIGFKQTSGYAYDDENNIDFTINFK